jgi:hypothetical protein
VKLKADWQGAWLHAPFWPTKVGKTAHPTAFACSTISKWRCMLRSPQLLLNRISIAARIAITALILLTPLASYASEAKEAVRDTWDVCRASNECKIEYDHLATQDTDPFMFLGHVMDREQARWSQYRRSIELFPDVRNCLVEEEREKTTPNLLLIDWDRTGVGRDAEICIYLIVRSLSRVDQVVSWLKYHGFIVGEVRRHRSKDYIARFETQPVSTMTAYWSVEQYREKNPSWLRTLFGIDLAEIFEVTFKFSESNHVVGVRISIPSK